MSVAIVQFGGSNCDYDVLHVLQDIIGLNTEMIWYKEGKLVDFDGIVIPGGFSYGDYLRAGAIAARTPIMESVKELALAGKPILGICNGFQILTESGLLSGALTTNRYPKFKCQPTYLKVENTKTPFTSRYRKDEIISIPIAHKEGNFYADNDTFAKLTNNNNIAFRYADVHGQIIDNVNPNGSLDNIAGTLNDTKNVLGMMPHPERAAEDILGSKDGLKIFESMADYITGFN